MVWTRDNRPRYDRRGQRYPSDITNDEWDILKPLLPVAEGTGRPRRHTLREVMNGIRYVQRYGIPWDAMPKDLPPGSICYDYWRLLSDGGHMDRINHDLVMADVSIRPGPSTAVSRDGVNLARFKRRGATKGLRQPEPAAQRKACANSTATIHGGARLDGH